MSEAPQTHGYSLHHREFLARTSLEASLLTRLVTEAPSEAEAQCAELARGGKVYAAGSEDMDTLTFNAPILFRHLTFSEAKKEPILEVNLEAALEGLEMNMSTVCSLGCCAHFEKGLTSFAVHRPLSVVGLRLS